MTNDHTRLMEYINKTPTGSKRTAEINQRGSHHRPAVFIEPSKQRKHNTKSIKTS